MFVLWIALPVRAGGPIPFNGSVSGQIPADMGPPVPGTGGCVFDFFVSNTGNATQIGDFTGTSNFIPNVCDGSYTGSFNWIAPNGDTISGPFFGQLIPTGTPGVFDNTETAIVTGGTGAYAGATGTLTLTGQVNFATSSFVLPFQGTIWVPATQINSSYTGATNGLWNDANNWSSNTVPMNGNGDVFNVTIPNRLVNLNLDPILDSLTLTGSAGRLAATDHSLTVLGGTSLAPAGRLTLTAQTRRAHSSDSARWQISPARP